MHQITLFQLLLFISIQMTLVYAVSALKTRSSLKWMPKNWKSQNDPIFASKLLHQVTNDYTVSEIDDAVRFRTLVNLRGGNTVKFSLIRWAAQQLGQLYKHLFKKRDVIIKQGLTRVVKESLLETSPTIQIDKTTRTKSSSLIRLRNELKLFLKNPPGNCKVEVGANIREWTVSITGAKGTIYEGETYKLQFKFPKEYPNRPPVVYFQKPAPKHRHVYTNGDICLSILGSGWLPSMTAESVAVSILSMLSSAKEKSLPVDNAAHAEITPGSQQYNYLYHDDKC